jgi:conjugal transfer/entry exclusion protein
MNTANSYIQTAQDIRQTARKIGTIGAEAVGLSSEDGQAILKFIQSGKNLHGSLMQTADIDERMKRSFANSKYLTWEDYVRGIGDRREQGDATAKSLYDSAKFANDQLAKAYEQHQKIVKDLPGIEGVTDAAVSTTQAVGVLIQQNQAVLQMMSEQARAQGQELQRQAIEREDNERALKAHHDKLKGALAGDKALIENLGKPQ